MLEEQKKKRIPWNKGKTGIYSIETRKKIGDAQRGGHRNLGIPKSEEHRKKISKTLIGRPSLLKGRNIWKNKIHPRGMLGKKRTEESNKKTSVSLTGIKRSEETRRKMSEANKGSKCFFWKGGIYPLKFKIRDLFEYRQWVSDVFTRDNFICNGCNQRGGKLEAHHIKPYSLIIKENNISSIEEAIKCSELWNINNGITLCKECHKKTDSYLKSNL